MNSIGRNIFRTVLTGALFFIALGSSLYADDWKEFIAQYQTDMRREILSGDFAFMRTLYNESKERAAEYIVDKLYSLVLENPDVNLEPVKDIIAYYETKRILSKEEIDLYAAVKYRDKNVQTMRATLFDLLNKDFKSAQKNIAEAKDWANKESEFYKDTDDRHRNELFLMTMNTGCDQAIIAAIIAGKKNLPPLDKDIIDLWKNRSIYSDELLVFRYLTTLIVYNRTGEFEKTVSAENFEKPYEDHSIFLNRESAEIYFEWFDAHRYWLTPEFTELLSKLRKSEPPKYRSVIDENRQTEPAK
jgi:hypothetical protein